MCDANSVVETVWVRTSRTAVVVMCLCGFDFPQRCGVRHCRRVQRKLGHCYFVGGHYSSSGNSRFLLIGLIGTEDTPKEPGFCCFDDSQRQP